MNNEGLVGRYRLMLVGVGLTFISCDLMGDPVAVWPPLACPLCSNPLHRTWAYDAPPTGETRFDWGTDHYHREIHECGTCGHFVSLCDLDLSRLYEGAYVGATYGRDGMQRTFDRILALPPERSDNTGRVARIEQFASQYWSAASRVEHPLSLLDIGSGLGVFPYKARQAGWQVTALDPDPDAIAHIQAAGQSVGGITTYCGDFLQASTDCLGQHHLITLNKVLEHVTDPVTMLAKCTELLLDHGCVYVELPDGEAAAAGDGFGREEFFIEHHHAFSLASIALLAKRAGYQVLELDRLREPSSKYTLRVFLSPV